MSGPDSNDARRGGAAAAGAPARISIANSVCIVTGASSGIGAAAARALAAAGARVVAVARRADRLADLAASVPGILAIPMDVTDHRRVGPMIAQVLGRHGHIDVLVNGAGQGLHVPVMELDPADLRAVFELNVVAPLMLMQAVLPAMRSAGTGAIVNVSSAASLRVVPGLGGYAVTKAGLNALSQTARRELAESGIAVSVVYPSVTASEFHLRLRAGTIGGAARGMPADPPELPARSVIYAIETGAAHVVVGDPPREVELGAGEAPGRPPARRAG